MKCLIACGFVACWVIPSQLFAGERASSWTPCAAFVAASAEPTGALAAQGATDEAAKIEARLKAYDDAFNAKDLDKLGTFYQPDVTILEGGGVNNGWADYRDHHLGPELKELENLRFSHSNVKAHVLGDGRSAYVTSNYAIKARVGTRDIDSGGLETLVLVKGDDGAWKIRHSHTSSRPRRPPQ